MRVYESTRAHQEKLINGRNALTVLRTRRKPFDVHVYVFMHLCVVRVRVRVSHPRRGCTRLHISTEKRLSAAIVPAE